MKRSLLPNTRPRAVVLTSGGLDSAVALALTAQTHAVIALMLSYGQRNAERELACARALAASTR